MSEPEESANSAQASASWRDTIDWTKVTLTGRATIRTTLSMCTTSPQVQGAMNRALGAQVALMRREERGNFQFPTLNATELTVLQGELQEKFDGLRSPNNT
jgi:hypothetical protein